MSQISQSETLPIDGNVLIELSSLPEVLHATPGYPRPWMIAVTGGSCYPSFIDQWNASPMENINHQKFYISSAFPSASRIMIIVEHYFSTSR